MPWMSQNQSNYKCYVPVGSFVLKYGELFKIGKQTGRMFSRFFILRDSALFVYRTRSDLIPYKCIPLRGLLLKPLKHD